MQEICKQRYRYQAQVLLWHPALLWGCANRALWCKQHTTGSRTNHKKPFVEPIVERYGLILKIKRKIEGYSIRHA